MWLAVLVLCAIGLVIRMVDYNRGMWEDELTIAYYTQLPISLVLPTVAHNGAHPPLYFLLATVDNRLGFDILAAIRLPSVVAGVLTIGVVYFIVLRLAGRAAAVVAAALTTFAPVAVWYSDEARMYALVWFFVLTSYLWLVWGHDSRHWRVFAVLHGITVSLALWTDYSAALALVPQPLLILLLRRRWWFMGSWLAGWLTIVPWLFFLREQYGRIQAQRFPGLGTDLHSWIAVLLDLAGVHANYAALNDTLPYPVIVAVLLLLAAALVATAFGVATGRIRIAVFALCLTLGALAVTATLAFQGTVAVVAPRVMGIIAFGFVLVFAAGVAAMVARESRAPRMVAAVCAAVLVASSIAEVSEVLQKGTNGTHWNTIAGTIDSQADPGDALIYYPVATKYAIDPYLAPSSRWRDHWDGSWPKDGAAADQTFARWTAGKPRVWLVFYAISGVDMPARDRWFEQHNLCRVMGDPGGPLGLLEYQLTATQC